MQDDIYKINCLGQKCPIPITRLEKAWRKGHMVVEIISDDPISLIDIPLYARQHNSIVKSQTENKNVIKFVIAFKKPFDLS